ncbi:CinA family protein [Cryobacterium arcticum]|nr:CinA family protein [Cryobacterium arcticum]
MSIESVRSTSSRHHAMPWAAVVEPKSAEEQRAQISALAGRIGLLAAADRLTVVVAESLTAGRISQALGAVPASAEWFGGGVIAYQDVTLHRLLGVQPGPVVSAQCAEQTARAVMENVGADVSVAVTGVAGPGPEEGQPAGTVFISVSTRSAVRTFPHRFEGSPEAVVALTTITALRHLREVLLD